MNIIGISAYYHDSAACLVQDGRIVAAAQEERFTRKKHDAGFPLQAIRYCLAEASLGAADIDHVVFYDKPFLKFERLLETYLAFAPAASRALPLRCRCGSRTSCSRRACPGARSSRTAGPGRRLVVEAAVLRAPPQPRGVGVFSLAVRRGRGAHHGRRGRVDHHLAGDRPGQQPGHPPGDPLSPFAGTAVLGLHPLHRLQGQLRRIQGHGPGALWRAALTPTRSRNT